MSVDPSIANLALNSKFLCFQKVFATEIKSYVSWIERSGFFLFYLHGEPIMKIEILGITTKIVKRAKSVLFYVDDGTEVLRCIQFVSQDEVVMSNSIQLGDTVSVKGLLCLSETNEEEYGICLKVNMIEEISDVHAELFHWLLRMQ